MVSLLKYILRDQGIDDQITMTLEVNELRNTPGLEILFQKDILLILH